MKKVPRSGVVKREASREEWRRWWREELRKEGGGKRGRGSEIISLLISQVVGKKRQASFCKHRLGPQSCGRHATRIANIQYIYTHTLKITKFEAVCLTIKIIFQIINEVNALFTLSIIPTH